MKKFFNSDVLKLLNEETNREVLIEYIQRGDIDINTLGADGATVLHRAIYLNNKEVVNYLLNLKKDDKYIVDVNKEDDSGMTPLAIASFCGRVEIVKMLIDRDDVVVTNEEDVKDPLGIACMENNEEVAKVILKSGRIDLKKRKQDVKVGVPLLHCAYAKNNINLMKELIEHGIDINDKDNRGLTVAHYAVLQQNSKRRINILKLLVEGSKNCINIVDNNKDTILHYACKLEYIDVVRFLVSQKNLKVNSKNTYGFTALHFACLKNRKDIVELLLMQKDIDIDIKENEGVTPLHIAVNRNNNEIVKLLLDNGADINVTDKKGLSLVHYAYFANNADMMRFLLKREDIRLKGNMASDMVFNVCTGGYTDILEMLLDKMSIDLGIKNSDGRNLLWLACDSGNVDMVKMILNRSDITVEHKNSKDYKGLAPLHRACFKRHIEVVQLLLEQNDVDINVKDNEEWTPLHYMTYANYTDVIKMLLEDPRIKVNERDTGGCTPIRYACDRNDINLVNVLLQKGGDLTIRDSYGLSPIHMVFIRDNEQVRVEMKQAILKELVKICRNNDITKLDNLLNICRVVQLRMDKECLRLACNEGNGVVLEYLLRKGVNVNQRYENGETLMYYACLNDNANIVSILVSYNVDVVDDMLNKYVNNNKHLVTSKQIIQYVTFKFLQACESNNESEALKLLRYDMDINILAQRYQSIFDVWRGNNNIIWALEENLSKQFPVALENKNIYEINLLLKLGINLGVVDRYGKSVLMHAIDGGYLAFAKDLIYRGVDIGVCDSNGMDALMYASKNGSIDIVNMLLQRGQMVDVSDKNNKTALMYALESRSYKVAWSLIRNGINIMAEDNSKKNVLMYALESGMRGVAMYLLKKGTYAYSDIEGRTLLMYAAKGAARDVLNCVLSMGFDINYVNKNKESALLWAIEGGNRDAVEHLLKEGAKVSLLGKKEKRALKELTQSDSKTTVMIAIQEYDINKIEKYPKLTKMALVYAITYRYDPVAKYLVSNNNVNMIYNYQTLLTYTINNGNEYMMSYLINNGANVNGKSKNKITALMAASSLGYTKIVKKLVESGAGVELMDSNGMTAIWYAFLGSRNKDTIDYLLSCGARLYGMDYSGMNMLMYASKYGLEYTVEELINRGFGVNFSNKEGKTALLYALENGNDRIVRILIKNKANMGVVRKSVNNIFRMSAIMRKDFSIEEVKKYINGNSVGIFFNSLGKKNLSVSRELIDEDMNDVDENGKTTLMYLCENGIEGAKLFINNNIGINDVDNEGKTPLMYAMKGDNKNIIRALICEGADLDAANKNGKTILMYAIELNQETVLQYRNMRVDVCDNNGDTALMYAVKMGYKNVVEELLLRYADTNIINKDGKTALMVAIETGKLKIAKVIMNYSLTDVNKQNERGETAMTYAARYKYSSLVKELLEKGADIPKDRNTIMYIKSLTKNNSKMQKKQQYVPAVHIRKHYNKELNK